MLVDDRIDFNNLEAGHASVVGDDFHGQVGFTITGAAAHRSSHAGSVFRIDPIHVERNVISGGVASGNAQRFFNHSAHAALINIAHGVDLNAGLLDIFLLPRIHIANA